MIFKNSKVYDVLKWIVMVALPATTALWLALAGIWGFPYAEEIVNLMPDVVVMSQYASAEAEDLQKQLW